MVTVESVRVSALSRVASLACPRNCSGHGVCQGGVCVCQVQWTGGECRHANYPYVVTFGTVFTLLTLVSFTQLALAIYHDAQRNRKARLREGLRFSAHKWLYFVAWLAAGSRAFSFIMQEGLSTSFALGVQSIYYPFLITLGSLLACLLGERYYVETPSSEGHSINKSLFPYIGFNVMLWGSFLVMIVLTFALPVEDQAVVHRAFYLVFAVCMLLSVICFLFFGIMMFYKLTGAFLSDDNHVSVNSTQLNLSRAGVFFQALFQLALVTLLVVDFSSHFIELSGHPFNHDLFNIISRVTDLAVVIWFPCALWNYKRPDTMWILNPRQVLDVDAPCEVAPLFASNQLSYGSTTVRRVTSGRSSPSATSGKTECWICYDNESSDRLICPCECKGGTAAVHHDCLKRWLVEQQDGSYSMFRRTTPRCDICKTPYDLEKPTCFKLVCTNREVVRIVVLSALALVVISATIAVLIKFSTFFQHDKSPFPTEILVIFGAIIAVVVLLRFLGVTCNVVCNRSLMLSVSISGRPPSSSSEPAVANSSSSSGTSRHQCMQHADDTHGDSLHAAVNSSVRLSQTLTLSEAELRHPSGLSTPVFAVDPSPTLATVNPIERCVLYTNRCQDSRCHDSGDVPVSGTC